MRGSVAGTVLAICLGAYGCKFLPVGGGSGQSSVRGLTSVNAGAFGWYRVKVLEQRSISDPSSRDGDVGLHAKVEILEGIREGKESAFSGWAVGTTQVVSSTSGTLDSLTSPTASGVGAELILAAGPAESNQLTRTPFGEGVHAWALSSVSGEATTWEWFKEPVDAASQGWGIIERIEVPLGVTRTVLRSERMTGRSGPDFGDLSSYESDWATVRADCAALACGDDLTCFYGLACVRVTFQREPAADLYQKYFRVDGTWDNIQRSSDSSTQN